MNIETDHPQHGFTPIDSNKLYQTINASRHTYIVTSNQRLSRARLEAYEQQQIKHGQHAWTTPNILPWSAWLNEQWQHAHQGLWLNKQQESLLWRSCIAEDTSTHVLNPRALSKQAMDAWKILADYHIDPTCLQQGGEEHHALWRWAQAVEHKTKHTLQHQVLSLLTTTTSHQEHSTIILDGFDSFTPAQYAYLNHLKSTGHHILEVYNSNPSASNDITCYADEESELRQTCQRIRTLQKQQPTYSIGVFIPDLEQRATTVSRIFSEELAPALSLHPSSEQQGDYFNISVGSILAKQPMIQSAFMLLSLTLKHQIQHQALSQLLLSPYIAGYNDEINQRAQLDFELRQHNQNQLTLAQVLHILQHAAIESPLLEQTLSQIIAQQQTLTGQQTLSYWVSLADTFLQEIQWQEQARNSNEYAQLQGWQTLVHQLTQLDDFSGLISWSDAISRLQEHGHEQPFRPAPGRAHIQVMGLLEAANLRFDTAFILGMDNHTWPPAAKPHPLIPFHIQAQHQTPHANSEREWQYAQAVWQNIQHVTPHLHISYSKSKAGQDVLASALLDGFGPIKTATKTISCRYANDLQQYAANIQSMTDSPLPITNSEKIRGGTGILKSQSACAFQAFARHRLQLKNLESPSLGLNSQEQGILLHAALERFWQHCQNHNALLSWIQSNQLEANISSAIQDSWASLNRIIPAEIRALEDQRLQQLLTAWLHFESKRPPFKVKGCEVWRDIHLGTKAILTLHLKLDRMDCDEAGNLMILDYKTGESLSSKAMGERPDEPQLPAYLLAEAALKSNVTALAFAQVRHDNHTFKGFAQTSNILPEIKAFKAKKDEPENWEALIAYWQTVLDQLADDFLGGTITVNPKTTQSCQYCRLQGLCRISTS